MKGGFVISQGSGPERKWRVAGAFSNLRTFETLEQAASVSPEHPTLYLSDCAWWVPEERGLVMLCGSLPLPDDEENLLYRIYQVGMVGLDRKAEQVTADNEATILGAHYEVNPRNRLRGQWEFDPLTADMLWRSGSYHIWRGDPRYFEAIFNNWSYTDHFTSICELVGTRDQFAQGAVTPAGASIIKDLLLERKKLIEEAEKLRSDKVDFWTSIKEIGMMVYHLRTRKGPGNHLENLLRMYKSMPSVAGDAYEIGRIFASIGELCGNVDPDIKERLESVPPKDRVF